MVAQQLALPPCGRAQTMEEKVEDLSNRVIELTAELDVQKWHSKSSAAAHQDLKKRHSKFTQDMGGKLAKNQAALWHKQRRVDILEDKVAFWKLFVSNCRKKESNKNEENENLNRQVEGLQRELEQVRASKLSEEVAVREKFESIRQQLLTLVPGAQQ